MQKKIKLFKMKVAILIPTHKNMIRIDHNDEVYRTAEEKWE